MTTFPTPVPFVAASLVLGLAAELRAEPLDISNPTPRTVRVEFEVSPHPEDLGLAWSPPIAASFSVSDSGDRAVVVVDEADYEDFLATYGGPGGFTIIPGSWFPFVLMIDLADLDADGYSGGHVDFPPGGGGGFAQVWRSFQTYGFAGWFELTPGSGQYLFCPGPLPFATCHPVSTSAYDPATGLLNAPGRDMLIHSDIPPAGFSLFSMDGELRLSEVGPAVPALPFGWPLALYGLVVAAGLRGSKNAGASARRRRKMRCRG